MEALHVPHGMRTGAAALAWLYGVVQEHGAPQEPQQLQGAPVGTCPHMQWDKGVHISLKTLGTCQSPCGDKGLSESLETAESRVHVETRSLMGLWGHMGTSEGPSAWVWEGPPGSY